MIDDASGYVITAGDKRVSRESHTNRVLRRSVLRFIVNLSIRFDVLIFRKAAPINAIKDPIELFVKGHSSQQGGMTGLASLLWELRARESSC